MASEAKIGLLLGLVIIFIVAFVINGLPRFGRASQSDDLTTVVDDGPDGIRPGVPSEVFRPGRIPDPSHEDGERYRDLIPRTTPPGELVDNLVPDAPGRANSPGAPSQAEPARPAWPKIHVVRKGENLADIAKIYYGPKEGNRRANVKRIFESNRNLLESPDKIFPGQRLVIPSLWASGRDRETIEQIFPEPMFERVASIGRRHF